MKIAVIGAGIAGLSAAWCLGRRHDVVLFEQEPRAGGHSHTVNVPAPGGGEQPIDTGFIVYNPPCYPNLTALFAELGVAVQKTAMSFSVSLGGGAYEWAGSDNLLTVFAQPSNLLRPAHWRLIRDILALNRRCAARLAGGDLPAGSLGEFLHDERFGAELRSRYLLPMAGMIWSCSPRQAQDYPAADFLRFFDAHGLFTATRQPQWYSVVGGSRAYVERMLARGTLRLRTRVDAITRGGDGVQVHHAGGAERFDGVISACHADQALRLLGDASELERAVLGGIPYSANRTVLHSDTTFMPRRRAAWASWNYLHEDDEIHDRPIMGSYWMNRLQSIPGPVDYIVTLNPTRAVDPGKILYETVYHHPHYTAAAVQTHARLPQIQGRGGVWWAGAWTRYGFHEDGLRSGLMAVAAIDRDCLPAWARL